jgi:tetratricopeptide (TPR) repeat protein
MTPELYQRLKPLYDAALDAPTGKRAQFVDEACRGDPELREQLQALLAAHDESTGPLDVPLVNLRNLYAAKPRTLADGDLVLGRFEIVRILGSGGMGEVYEAEDRLLRGVRVALKTILPHGAGDPELQKRFEREVLLAREVTHPNLCPIHTIFHCDDPPPGYLFLTMKLLPGQTLAARLREPPAMTNEEGLAVLRQASLGVAAIHAAGIIHRDIKPNNMMVDGSGSALRLWITDFGLARAYETESTVSSMGTVAGTPGYIAPELFLGHPPSQASDLFALGVVLHEVFAGEKPAPVPGTHSYTVSPRLATQKAPALSVRLITECLQDDPQRRCTAFARTLEVIDPKLARNCYSGQSAQFWSRRRFAGAAAAAICAIAGAAWWKRDALEEIVEDIFEPLPDKRYVALMPWPTSDSAAVVSTVLDSIGQRLARAEATVKNLLIIRISDLPGTAAAPATPAASVSALGANLVLAASLQSTPSRVWLNLQVLEAATQRVLRAARVSSSPAALSGIAGKASEAAAKLLGLPEREIVVKDTEELQRVSPEVFRTFSEAEQLANQASGAALEAAVAKYQQALYMDPRFALGYARLSIAYARQYLVNHEPARVKLAQSNTSLALRYNPSSAMGLLSQAIVLLYSDQLKEANDYFSRSLKADPGNPETLLYKGQALRNAGKWPEAEQVYRAITVERPNYWPAHNELGWILYRQAKYKESAEEFDTAAASAPQVALPLANLGSIYMYLGKRAEAIDASQRSIRVSPNDDAYITLGDIAFSDAISDRNHASSLEKYKSSLENYKKAAALNPNSDMIQGNIGDCYAKLGDLADERKSYQKAAQLLTTALTANPSNGPSWATLAFYHAKTGDSVDAQADIKNAKTQGATDVQSQFMIAQALAVLGKKEDALNLLLACMDKGLSPVQVGLAVDLKDIRRDPRYLSRVAKLQPQTATKAPEAHG